jgi:nucleotidyltransferase substrate binding protein (TIGR01987 family)
MIDLSILSKAIAQVDEALAFCRSDLATNRPDLALHLRAGAIQAFEFTYELAIKTLKRHLEANEPNPGAVDEMSFNDLIRRGYEIGLLGKDLATWKQFRIYRGTTSHAYDQSKAMMVYAGIPAFIQEAKYLLDALRKRQENA